MNRVERAYQLGQAAFEKGNHFMTNDEEMLSLFGEVGTNMEIMDAWIEGYDKAKEQQIRRDFPEFYTTTGA